MKRLIITLIAVLVFAGATVTPIHAAKKKPTTLPDATAGSVKVVVTDADGKPAANVTITLKGKAAKKATPTTGPVEALTGVTNADGVLVLSNVPVGNYTVVAKIKGSTGRGKATVTSGSEITVPVAMTPKKPKSSAAPANNVA